MLPQKPSPLLVRWSSLACVRGSLHPVVALFLKLESKLLSAFFDDASVGQHVHLIRNDKIQQPLIMRHQDDRVVGGAKLVHTLGNDPESVNIEARIRLVQN